MAPTEALEPLPIPDRRMWSSIGVDCGTELHGGYQSRVFAAERAGEAIVAKLTDSRVVDRAFGQRVELTAALATIDESVVGPLTMDAGLVVELGGWLATIYPLVVGRAPDVRTEREVRRMASTMARLHRSLLRLGPYDVPTVAALAGSEWDDAGTATGFSQPQLLHGDFSPSNLLLSDRAVRVFDFDGCGYGPIEFEVGNTLYMMLFDAAMSSDPSAMAQYERSREWFVHEYRSSSSHGIPDDAVERSIALRVQALGRWIEQPATAPIGIRSATPAWRDALGSFVRSQSGR